MNRKQRRATRAEKRRPNPAPGGTTAELNPTGVVDLLATGWKLHKLGRLAEAEVWYRRVLAAQPDHGNALNLLGIVAHQTGRHEFAVELIGRAIQMNGHDASYFSNLGIALVAQVKLDEAIAAFRQAISIKPDYAEAYCNLGSVLEQQGRLDEAVVAQQQAITINPSYADAYSNLGVALEEQGKLNEARKALERAIELAPQRALTYRLLSEVKRFDPADLHLVAMEKLAQDMESLSAEDQINLHFALAKAYRDIGDHERSFRLLLEGNALKRQRISYNDADVRDFFSRIRNVFTPALLHDRRGVGDPSSKPVFVIGMPRSGTTLVEQILASHPRVYGAGELDYMSNLAKHDATMGFPEVIYSMTDDQIRQLGTDYVNSVSRLAPNADRIVDKLPTNFVFTGLIHLALPKARIIHMRREPIDTCVSCFSKLFTYGHPYTYNLVELARYYRAYEVLMAHWRDVLPPGIMLEVYYESLTFDLEAGARRIVEHCGLGWDSACLSFHETERPVRTTVEVRQPIYRSSIGRWRAYAHLLQPLIEALTVDVASPGGQAPVVNTEDHPATSSSARPPHFPAPDIEAEVYERADIRQAPIFPRLLGETSEVPTRQIPLDGIKAISIQNGLLRVDCVAAGPNREEQSSGTLLMAVNQIGSILRGLKQATQELDTTLREQAYRVTKSH